MKTSDLTPTTQPRRRHVRNLLIGMLFLAAYVPGEVRTETIYGVTLFRELITFDSAAPATILSSVQITGLTGQSSNEIVRSIDFRPATKQLYAIGSAPGTIYRIYTIDIATGLATQIGRDFQNSGTGQFGFNFDPVNDLIRIVTDDDRNVRYNPVDGSQVAVDQVLGYAAGDPNFGGNPNLVAASYSNSATRPTTTTLFAIDSVTGALVTQAPPDAGTLHTVGPLGVNLTNTIGFEISGATNIAYASVGEPGMAFKSMLYTINLSTGAATLVGKIGSNLLLYGIAILVPDTPPSHPHLVNISTRLNVLPGDDALIEGFIITGNASKKVIVRAIGPSLPVVGPLADPTLQLHRPDGAVLTNDNWMFDDQTQQSQEAKVRATTVPPSNDLESALVDTLPPGAYTAILRGKGDATGVGLVEAYDLDQAADAKLANISTRGFVDTGDSAIIGGFILAAPNPARVILRAIAPSLSNAGVPNALQDPTLDLRDANGTQIAFNNDWQETDSQAIRDTGVAPTDPRESAIVSTLVPGSYTAIVRGLGNTTGIGLVEVYDLTP